MNTRKTQRLFEENLWKSNIFFQFLREKWMLHDKQVEFKLIQFVKYMIFLTIFTFQKHLQKFINVVNMN